MNLKQVKLLDEIVRFARVSEDQMLSECRIRHKENAMYLKSIGFNVIQTSDSEWSVTVREPKLKPFRIMVKEVTLLSKEQYVSCANIIRKIKGEWWLNTPDPIYKGFVACANDSLSGIVYNHAQKSLGIRPALIFARQDKRPDQYFADESCSLKPGYVFVFAGNTWTVISEGTALCDNIVETSPFMEDVAEKEQVYYKDSDVKGRIDKWAAENVASYGHATMITF